MGRPIKARSDRNGKPVKPVGIPVRTGYTCAFEFGFEFNQFPPVFGQTGPVNQYRRAAV